MDWDRIQRLQAIYTGLLNETGLEARDLFNVGIALYRANDFVAAAEAFERLTRLQPNSRDAWFNYTNSLFAAESWELAGDLLVIGLTEVDPLGRERWSDRRASPPGTWRRAIRGGGVGQDRVRSSPRGRTPVASVRAGHEPPRARGKKRRRAWDPGTPPIHVLWCRGRPGDGTAHRLGPPSGSTPRRFEISFAGQATAYRYELVSPLSPPIP